MSKRARDEDGEISSARELAKAKRDAKWNWVNDQARFKVNIDHQRAFDLARTMRHRMGYDNPNPTFDEVIKVMEMFDRMRHFVWDRMDVDREFIPMSDWAGRDSRLRVDEDRYNNLPRYEDR